MTKGLKILIVDDDDLMRKMVATLLESLAKDRQMELELVEACDGLEAIEKMESENFDVMALDLKMPRMDGFGVIENVRKMPSELRPRIFLITAWPNQQGVEELIKIGHVSKLVSQPINVESLKILLDDPPKKCSLTS